MKQYPFLTLSGASGSGKTTLMEELIARLPERFSIFRSVTTRSKRPSDKPGAFEYVSRETFAQWEAEGRFAWTVNITENRYGTTKATIEEALKDTRTAISPIAPDIVATLGELVGKENVFSVYILSLPVHVVKERLHKRGDTPESVEERIKNDVLWDEQATHSEIPYHFVENTGTVDELVTRVLALLDKAEGRN